MKILLLLLLSCITTLALAQPGDRYSKSLSFMEFKDPKTKLYGFKNEKGKIISPAVYSAVDFDPTWGKWTVTKDSLMGFYTLEGDMILPPIYKFIEPNYEPNNEFIVVSKDNQKYGLMNMEGLKILDLKYPHILDFKKNLLRVGAAHKDSIYNRMIIDTAQNVILDGKVIHANVYEFVEDYPYDSTHVLYIQAIKDEKFALFASTGRQISDFIFTGSFSSRSGLVHARLSYTGNTCGVIDKNNKIIIPFIYSSAGVCDNGTIAVSTKEGNRYYFDTTGKSITEKEFKVRQIKNPNWKTD